jgi:uncharacterized membrane protein
MSNDPTTPFPEESAPPAPLETVVVPKHSPILTHIRSSIFSGLITLVPLFITVYLLWILFDFATKFSKPVAQAIVPVVVRLFRDAPADDALVALITSWTWPILAIVITIVVVYILGVLSIFAVGRRILAHFEHFIENLPLVKGIYGTTKQVVGVFRQGSGGQGFQRVVLVQFPRLGTWSVAFVTNTIHDEAANERLVCCFIPMTPNPTSGFFQMFPESDVRATDWTVDMGIKIILSGGLLAPTTLRPTQPPTTA